MIVLKKLYDCLYLPKLKTNGVNTKLKLVFSDAKSTKLQVHFRR